MIVYQYGLRHLLRMHGSPVFKVILPTTVSTCFLLFISWARTKLDDEGSTGHPYSVGAFMGFFSFLLTFRLNYAYQRYWEAATAVHQMLSKWLDVAMTLAAWHYQAHSYNDIKPPAFGLDPRATPDAMNERPHALTPSFETIEAVISEPVPENTSWYSFLKSKIHKMDELEKMQRSVKKRAVKRGEYSVHSAPSKAINTSSHGSIPIPSRFQDHSIHEKRGVGGRPPLTKQTASSSLKLTRKRPARTPKPSLFLQELAHLSSLLSAVAMSTLRNDIEMAESPLTEYIPGQPWPPMDPDNLSKETLREYGESSTAWRVIYFVLGLSRSEKHRTLYNAARPFTVLGGVSDQEILTLQNARGPYAKTALCFMWLQEFISRETLRGSTGDINGAILSRLFQYQSDGMVGYNAARKIAYVPFPFVNAQIIAFFSLCVIFIYPLLYVSFVNKLWFACFLNSLTVLCSLGMHEVARELENPFTNVPNDLPLCTFQAQYNEALGTMFSGYHPDSWFTIEEVETPNSKKR